MIDVNRIVDWLKQSSDWTSQLNHYSKVLDNFARLQCLMQVGQQPLVHVYKNLDDGYIKIMSMINVNWDSY